MKHLTAPNICFVLILIALYSLPIYFLLESYWYGFGCFLFIAIGYSVFAYCEYRRTRDEASREWGEK